MLVTWEHANRQTQGKLDKIILERRERGDSYADIAWSLGMEYGFRVSGETIRRWYLSAPTRASLPSTAPTGFEPAANNYELS